MWVRTMSALAFCSFVILSTRPAPGQEGPAPDVDPEAEAILRKMSDHISKVTHFSFEVIDTIDDVLDSGQKIQYSHHRSAIVSRPRKLRVDTRGDLINRSIWKDGKVVTILDRDHNAYAQTEDPGTIDDLIDKMLERYGVVMPLADLLSADPFEVLMRNVRSGEYLGLHRVGVHSSHHLAFRQDEIDWQIWIDSGDEPLPRKMIITYKTLPGEPQYTMVLQGSISFTQAPVPNAFTFTAPGDAEEIEFLPVTSSEIGTAPPGE